ncbi:hypothetical protein QJQ45_015835 [Haematococcus lacustris]|nr:hypothetical protein QJQ45_015835 [Haematococcus lacustris]
MAEIAVGGQPSVGSIAASRSSQGKQRQGRRDGWTRGAGQRRGRVVLVDEHRTSRVSSAVNGQQPCEEKLDKLSATRPAGWKPPAGQVEPRLVRPAWSQERGQPVRGLMWCPVVAPRKPPQAPRSSQAATQPAASDPGTSTPPPAKRSKPAAEPTKGKGKGKAAKAKPAPQPGRWLDRDCNAALNMQRIGESRWRPLELCYWPDQGALPAKGKEYPGLGYKRLRDKPPKAQQQQQQPAEAQFATPWAGHCCASVASAAADCAATAALQLLSGMLRHPQRTQCSAAVNGSAIACDMVDAASASIKLQRIVLSWDYWDLVRRAEEGGGPFENLREIPRTFRDVKVAPRVAIHFLGELACLQEYKEVFEPLLLEEYCAQMLRGVEEGDVYMPHPAVVSKTEQVDDFLHCRLALQPGASEHFVDNDLVLLCKNNPMEEVAGGEGGGLAGSSAQELHALGFCLGAEGEQSVRVKFRLGDESQLSNAAGLVRVRAMRAALLEPASCWWLLKLSNTATITREWVALQYAHACPFADIMLNCKPRAAPSSRHMDIPSGMKTAMEAECNTSQMEALCAGLDGTPLVLIQGPPGTGKTRTILNLLSVVMHAAQKGSLELMKVGGVGDQVTPFDEPGQQGDCFGLVRKVQPAKVGQASGPRAHVLVCAPSNSALDEIVLRILKSGLMDKDGAMYTPSLVRIGVNAHHSVRPVFLDTLVEARLGSDTGGKGGTGAGTISRVERDRIKLAILEEASVVCSTLSFAGSSLLQRVSRRFDVVVIDEAAQAVEPSTLVPLVMGCRQVYLVGDPVQLPATVMSSRAKEAAYDCSLFKRLQSGGYPVRVLDTQYRMNPAISAFPSRQFYNGKLLDGESVVKETMSAWHAQPVFGPLAFFDVAGRESIPANGASIQNKAEANMVLCIYRELVHRYPVLRKTASVAVISPYKAQHAIYSDSVVLAATVGCRRLDQDTAPPCSINTCPVVLRRVSVSPAKSVLLPLLLPVLLPLLLLPPPPPPPPPPLPRRRTAASWADTPACCARDSAICSVRLTSVREVHQQATPIPAQVKLLRDSFAAALGEEAAKLVDVNTIDGFQGREKDICIFSCVRALRKGSSSIGFVSDERRINVGLTRARCSLLVVGNTRALQRSPHWAALIHDCLQNGCMYRPKAPFADWMTAATSTGAQPVKATAKELGLLNKARSKLSATKEVEAVTSLQVAVAVAAAGDGGDAQGAAEVGALPDQRAVPGINMCGGVSVHVHVGAAYPCQAAAAAEAQLAEELHEEDLDAADEGNIDALQRQRQASKAESRRLAAEVAAAQPKSTKGGGGPGRNRPVATGAGAASPTPVVGSKRSAGDDVAVPQPTQDPAPEGPLSKLHFEVNMFAGELWDPGKAAVKTTAHEAQPQATVPRREHLLG